MLTRRNARLIWLAVAISGLALALAVMPLVTAAALGTLAGVVVGANAPEKWRKRLIVPKSWAQRTPNPPAPAESAE